MKSTRSIKGMPYATRKIVSMASGLYGQQIRSRADQGRGSFGRQTRSLAPYIVINNQSSASRCSTGYTNGGIFGFFVRGIVTDNLVATLSTGSDSDISSLANQSCVAANVFTFGAVNCSGVNQNISFTPKPGKTSPYHIPITWSDPYASFPPSLLAMP